MVRQKEQYKPPRINLLKKADDPYIALLNYRASPLQHGWSPAELLMGRKLRTRVPTIPQQHVPKVPDVKNFKKIDAQVKGKQKKNFDKRHRAKELPTLKKGQPVWVKKPKTREAEVVQSSTPRSVIVRTDKGLQRRNRSHLSHRSSQHQDARNSPPKVTSLLPDVPPNDIIDADEPPDEDDVWFDAPSVPGTSLQSGPQPSPTPRSPTSTYTKSGRKIHAPKRMDL